MIVLTTSSASRVSAARVWGWSRGQCKAFSGGEQRLERHARHERYSQVPEGLDGVLFDHRGVPGAGGDDNDRALENIGGGRRQFRDHFFCGVGGVPAQGNGDDDDVRCRHCPLPGSREGVVAGVGDKDVAVLGHDRGQMRRMVFAQNGCRVAAASRDDVLTRRLTGQVLRER